MPSIRFALALVAGLSFQGAALGVPGKADFRGTHPARPTRAVADWVVQARDNGASAFFVIDKPNARLYVFDPLGRLQGDAPVLLGIARGDDSFPGVGEKPLADIPFRERTTPAGRFVAQRGRNAQGEDIVWVDYANAVSLHRVRPLRKSEHRLQRLRSPTPADNRISYGCINVPVAFYNTVVERAWRSGGVIIYIVPEVKTVAQVFPRQRSLTNVATLLRRMGRNKEAADAAPARALRQRTATSRGPRGPATCPSSPCYRCCCRCWSYCCVSPSSCHCSGSSYRAMCPC